jgi:disulfide bond formation protein DsbB
MNMKNNKNLISFVFGLAIVLSIGLFAQKASAYTGVYTIESSSNPNTSQNYNNNNNYNNYNQNYNNNTNYSPVVYSASPGSVYAGSDTVTLNVSGSNFTPDSIVLFNNTFLPTTYYNSGRLTAVLNRSNLNYAGNHTIAVLNPNYGGGTSNRLNFSVLNNPNPVIYTTASNNTPTTNASNTTASSAPKNATTAKATTAKTTNSTSTKTTLSDGLSANALSASVIGSKTGCGFMPSTLLQWLILIFLVLIFVMLVRKAFFEKAYLETPLKKD